jgi:putative FmdB family regulatory protein
MPIYEYVCRDCGSEFEVLVRGDEKPSCPKCQGAKLTRQMSVSAAHTAGGSCPPCPAKEMGACGQSGCGGGGCGLSQMM